MKIFLNLFSIILVLILFIGSYITIVEIFKAEIGFGVFLVIAGITALAFTVTNVAKK